MNYNFFIPTKLKFGAGRIAEIGEIVSSFGNRCLVVTGPDIAPTNKIHNTVKGLLIKNNVKVIHYDGVVPNPTIDSINNAMKLAQNENIDCVLGLGGGSAIDSAKIIALAYSKKGDIDWETIFSEFTDPFKDYAQMQESLPLIAVTTTSGTGSHVTQAAVVTDSQKEEKLTIFHPNNFPITSIIDPELMLSMPKRGTAATGFDVFAHAFESYLGNRVSPLTETMSLQAMKLVFENLPKVLLDLGNIELRTNLAWADTLAGICLANGGADIPHPLSEIIGGICPRIAHGECLALVYPEFIEYKLKQSEKKIAKVAKYLNVKVADISDSIVAKSFYTDMTIFLKKVMLWASLKDYEVTENEYKKIIENPILDYLPFAKKSDLQEILSASYNRV